jgi:predicted RNA binding protein YcfA (HicA-like mRNA interferase family)
MSQLNKLVRFVLSCPSEASFDDIKRLLEAFGFQEVRSSGSHIIFRHEDGRMQSVPKKSGRKVKGIYIKQIIKLLSLEDWYNDQEKS